MPASIKRAGSWIFGTGFRAADATALFERMRATADEDPRLTIEGRPLPARKRAGSMAWFDFTVLCDGPRSQIDYLELACRFAVIIVSDVPRLTADMSNQARRFTWLVDVFYDHRVKLIVSAAVPAEELYVEGHNSQEFQRTLACTKGPPLNCSIWSRRVTERSAWSRVW